MTSGTKSVTSPTIYDVTFYDINTNLLKMIINY